MDGLSAILQIASDLAAAVVNFIRLLFPVKIAFLGDGEKGIVTFCGKFLRQIGPGCVVTTSLCEIDYCQAVGCYVDLSEQGVHTKDGKIFFINGAAVYDQVDMFKAIQMTEELESITESACMEGIRQYARTVTFDEMQDSDALTLRIRTRVNKLLKDYGIQVRQILIADFHPKDVQVISDTLHELVDKITTTMYGDPGSDEDDEPDEDTDIGTSELDQADQVA